MTIIVQLALFGPEFLEAPTHSGLSYDFSFTGKRSADHITHPGSGNLTRYSGRAYHLLRRRSRDARRVLLMDLEVECRTIESLHGRLDLAAYPLLATPLEVAPLLDHVALSTNGSYNSRILSGQFLAIAYLYQLALPNGSIIRGWQPYLVNLPPGTVGQASIRPENLVPVFRYWALWISPVIDRANT